MLKLTFYGYPDNDPPNSDAIAHPTPGRERAGGVGTYEDPVTTASLKVDEGGWLRPGQRLYAPSLKKYLIIEDDCADCVADQIDVWISGVGHDKDTVEACEARWTPNDPIEVELDPPPGREVVVDAFFKDGTGECRDPNA